MRALEPGAGRGGLVCGDVRGEGGEDGAKLVAAAAGGDGRDRSLGGSGSGEAALDVRGAGREAGARGGARVVRGAVAAQHLLDWVNWGLDAVWVSHRVVECVGRGTAARRGEPSGY